MERETTSQNDDMVRLDAAMWEYVTTGGGKNLSHDEVEHMYLYALFCIDVHRNLTAENVLGYMYGERDGSFMTDYSQVRESEFKLQEHGASKQRVSGLHTRASNLVDKVIFQQQNNE